MNKIQKNIQGKIQGKPHMETQGEYIQRQLYNYEDTPMKKPKHMASGGPIISYDQPQKDFEVIYKSMSPIEKGQFNASRRKSSPGSVIRVAGIKEDKEYFEEEKKKGKIPIEVDLDKFLDEKEEFELGGDPEVKLKKQRLQEMQLANALQKIDSAMTGIMTTLNLAGGGKVLQFSNFKKPKQPKKINLADYFKVGVAVADLNESERRLVNDLLKRTLGPNPK